MKRQVALVLACSATIFSCECALIQDGDAARMRRRTTNTRDVLIDVSGRVAKRYQSLSILFEMIERQFLDDQCDSNEDKARRMQRLSYEMKASEKLCEVVREDFRLCTPLLGEDALSVKRDVSEKLKHLFLLVRTAKDDITEIHGNLRVDFELQESCLREVEDALATVEDALVTFVETCTRASDERRIFSEDLFVWHTVDCEALLSALGHLERWLYEWEHELRNDESAEYLLSDECSRMKNGDSYLQCWNTSFEGLKKWIDTSRVSDAESNRRTTKHTKKIFKSVQERARDAMSTSKKLKRHFRDEYDAKFDDTDPRSYRSASAFGDCETRAKGLLETLQCQVDEICEELRNIQAEINRSYRQDHPLFCFLILEYKKVADEVAGCLLAIRKYKTRCDFHREAFNRRPALTWIQKLCVCKYD